ncbi:hypothetical protein [uncultured Pelagimonas sp.]|uniref:hypothetical protein n=1 Tax=uncultured Pelagimonas sp. TaxID=1618102 RepID=UPI0026141B42|nr:hypothetical protein [uncultured Pelagimonas sp.]
MLEFIKGKISVLVSNAAKRGNPLAQKLVANELRSFYGSMAVSPIVPGEFRIPDPSGDLDDEDDFATVPLTPLPVDPDRLIGERVSDASVSLGFYGMGSCEFFGLEMAQGWLILPIRGAGGWLHLDGRIVQDESYDTGEPRPWIVDADDRAFLERLQGAVITRADLGPISLVLEFDNGARLCLEADPATRPNQPGVDTPRAFAEGDDLADAVFLSPSGLIYV